jgi:transcriptional regulator with XRE-family HTH domain
MSTTRREKEEANTFLELLRDTRLNVGLRQVDLANRLGVPQSFVSKYESGERRLDLLEVRSVCHALNTTLPAFATRLESLLEGSK